MYHRLDPRLPQNFALDDVTALTAIQDFGHTLDLNPTLDFVDKYFVYDDVSALLRSRLWYAPCLTTVMKPIDCRNNSTTKCTMRSTAPATITMPGCTKCSNPSIRLPPRTL